MTEIHLNVTECCGRYQRLTYCSIVGCQCTNYDQKCLIFYKKINPNQILAKRICQPDNMNKKELNEMKKIYKMKKYNSKLFCHHIKVTCHCNKGYVPCKCQGTQLITCSRCHGDGEADCTVYIADIYVSSSEPCGCGPPIGKMKCYCKGDGYLSCPSCRGRLYYYKLIKKEQVNNCCVIL